MSGRSYFACCGISLCILWLIPSASMSRSPVGTRPKSTLERVSSALSTGKRTYTKQALERLSQVFGIDEVPKLHHTRSPPEYMTELYHTVAFSDGITKRSNPYDADVVRGFPDRAPRHQTQYYFNVSYVSKTEDVLVAELRLYKTRPSATPGASDVRDRRTRSGNVVELQLYQVLSETEGPGSAQSLRLLSKRRVSAHASGWQVFTVTETVREWVNSSDTNRGFMVMATSLSGTPVNGTLVRFAQRLEHHDSKQPVLIVFSGDMTERKYFSVFDQGQEPPPNDSAADASNPLDLEAIASMRREYIQSLNEGYRDNNNPESLSQKYRAYMSESQHRVLLQEQRQNMNSTVKRQTRKRNKRSKKSSRTKVTRRETNFYRVPSRRKNKACQRSELYVDFEEIGWSGWIISPKGYNAYHCWGECPFPLGQFHRPTNHATVQSIVYTMRIEKTVQLPCCVPDKLFSISLLYFDDEENVILKQYDEMVAASCGCH